MPVPELRIDGAVASITLRRPEQANRLEPDDLVVLADHIAAVNARPEVLVLVLQSKGKYFCSGYDISKIGGARNVEFDEVINMLEDCRPVTVAVLQGSVYGGATDMALACDFRIGLDTAEMFMPAARLGLHYYKGGIKRYVSRLGADNAKRLFLTAEKIDAQDMLRIGYLTGIATADGLDGEVDRLAATLAGNAPMAMRGMKQAINEFARGELDEAAADRRARDSMRGDEIKEGTKAFAEKRAPRF